MHTITLEISDELLTTLKHGAEIEDKSLEQFVIEQLSEREVDRFKQALIKVGLASPRSPKTLDTPSISEEEIERISQKLRKKDRRSNPLK